MYANKSILKSYAWMHAKSTITPSTDTIMDNLRLSEYLNKILIKKINGMNLMNSSPISENINGGMLMNVIAEPSELPAIPKFDKTIVIK